MNDALRIGDAEREVAARELGEHYAMGRISADEHAERLEKIWAARTAADLTPVFRDLPRPAALRPRAQQAGRPARAERAPRGWRPAWPRMPFLFKALLAVIVLWWGFHHPPFLLVALVLYVVVVRRVVHRARGGRRGPRPPWDRHYQAGWR
ncbi:MAG TPA: DUF1707 domain-containing protein [Nocardioides sp.]|jgi:Flp pilus assembly protein TadB|uniref:DUF1707 SHOCT-like domain-containing protein n=1 Tax=Nocardioides sp. TaxID=35761 RepID=UPI002E2FA109|nr:DUF1707 domain-containing protein [Nocardioides sp.]HEX3930275.1 DUF1707 domain-containing protein [Nocardioides sp.]